MMVKLCQWGCEAAGSLYLQLGRRERGECYTQFCFSPSYSPRNLAYGKLPTRHAKMIVSIRFLIEDSLGCSKE